MSQTEELRGETGPHLLSLTWGTTLLLCRQPTFIITPFLCALLSEFNHVALTLFPVSKQFISAYLPPGQAELLHTGTFKSLASSSQPYHPSSLRTLLTAPSCPWLYSMALSTSLIGANADVSTRHLSVFGKSSLHSTWHKGCAFPAHCLDLLPESSQTLFGSRYVLLLVHQNISF